MEIIGHDLRQPVCVQLKVIDTGVGMQEEVLTAIFEIKKDKVTKGTNGEVSSGLGLPLVKDLVEMNRGVIKVNSKKDQGTIFEIVLPAA